LRFQNPEKFANIWQVLTIQTVMPVGFTILLLYAKNKQRNQCNGASRFKETCLRKAQHYRSSLKEEKPLQFESLSPLTAVYNSPYRTTQIQHLKFAFVRSRRGSKKKVIEKI
jgi:hypothetical protein